MRRSAAGGSLGWLLRWTVACVLAVPAAGARTAHGQPAPSTGHGGVASGFEAEVERDRTMVRVLDELQRGPDLRSVQRAALAWHALDRAPHAPRRARSAHLLPDRVEVSGGWVQGGLLRDDVTVTEDFDDAGLLDDTRVRVYGREDLSRRLDMRVGLRWDLSGLVWSGDELAMDAAERRAADQRRLLMQAVADAWFARRRALAGLLLDPPHEPLRRLEREIAVDEASARLDAFTGGWFSVQLAADQRARATQGTR